MNLCKIYLFYKFYQRFWSIQIDIPNFLQVRSKYDLSSFDCLWLLKIKLKTLILFLQRLKWLAHLEFAQTSKCSPLPKKATSKDDNSIANSGKNKTQNNGESFSKRKGPLAWDTMVEGITRTHKLRWETQCGNLVRILREIKIKRVENWKTEKGKSCQADFYRIFCDTFFAFLQIVKCIR